MKILHITFSLGNGGKENMLVDIANEQFCMGNVVYIVVVNNIIDKSLIARISNGIKIFNLKRKSHKFNPLPFFKLLYLLKVHLKLDTIHAHDAELGRILGRMTNTPLSLTIHGMGLNTSSMRFFNSLYAVSNAVKEDIKKRGGLDSNVLYNGISTRHIKTKKIFIKEDSNYKIICVKRLDYSRTGQDLLINAINNLVKLENRKNIHVDIVGDGKSYKELLQMIDCYNLSENIRLVGNKNRDWVYEHLCDYDLFVLPSRFEAFGLTVAEAMAAKLLIIASQIDGPAEILEQGKYGILFENGNSEDLGIKIKQAISFYNSGQVESFVERAYQYCQIKFNIKTTAAAYCAAYPLIGKK